MPWPLDNEPEVAEDTETTSTWFTIKTYYKKSCEQQEYFSHPDWEGRIKVCDGFRFAEYRVETNDGDWPKIDFTSVPGGSDALDSVDLNCCFGDNVESTELVEMFDGGCWGDTEFPDDMPEEEQERLQEFIDENGSYALEDEEGWMLDETEVWVWGPLEVSDDEGNTRIVIADDSITNRQVIGKILEWGGHAVTLLEDGEDALDALESAQFDLVILDRNMPGMGGRRDTGGR